jgi:putative tricarboxylic transport membrane protein
MLEMYARIGDAIPVFINELFTFEMMFSIMFGLIGGMIIGILPGLSGTTGVALMIPFTYAMSPIPALTLLCAIYQSAITGGGFSAILIHTPGTPASVASLLDGYPLAQKGYPRRALGISLYSSTFGGLLSVIALLLLAPPLARVTLMFSSPEYFLLGCFGISIIASLASDSLAKGLASGVFGVLLSTVGTDNITSYPRFAYGTMDLMGGLNTAVVMIGLFSIAQVMDQASLPRLYHKDREDAQFVKLKKQDGSIDPKNKDTVVLQKWILKRLFYPTMVRSSIIGIGCGILPGAGGSIAGYLAYNEAKRFSKEKDEFGKGHLEGLCATESANNGVTGGGLIPLITLGIPGTPTAAIILGGLVIQGLRPGANLFTEQATITYSIIFGFLLATALMFPVGLVMCRYVAYVCRVPSAILTPAIVVLATIGTYAISGTMFNVYVMIAFGLIGYIIRKCGFHPAAFILGLILGYSTETGLRRSIIMSRGNVLGYFMERPICVVLFLITMFTLFLPIINRVRSDMKKKSDGQSAS